jgi:hypothetical protein
MAHDSGDVGVNINDYLGALGRYNLAYGPQPQGAGSTGGQNFAVRSSTEAPGFGYVNPETNELFPLYPQEEGAGQQSGFGFGDASKGFENYLTSIGAKGAHVGSPHIVKGGYNLETGDSDPYTDTRPEFFGQYPGRASAAGYTGPQGGPNPTSRNPQSFAPPNYMKFGEVPQYLVGAPHQYEEGRNNFVTRPYTTPGNLQWDIYTDPEDHFLGRGSNPEELFANSPQLQRSYYENLFASGQEQV